MSPDVQQIYRAAVSDAGRAATLQPDYAKAYFRQAKGYIGARDLPRARLFLERGLAACPNDRRALQKLVDEIKAIGIDSQEVHISNAYSGASEQAWSKVQAGSPCITCPFCVQPVPSGAEMKELDGHPFCPHCAADPTRSVDQKAIHALIRKC